MGKWADNIMANKTYMRTYIFIILIILTKILVSQTNNDSIIKTNRKNVIHTDVMTIANQHGIKLKAIEKIMVKDVFKQTCMSTIPKTIRTADVSFIKSKVGKVTSCFYLKVLRNDTLKSVYITTDNQTNTEQLLNQANKDILYSNNINPLATLPKNGVVVFGQKTLQKEASALDRVNVRRLLLELKIYIRQIADTILFEQNTISTRNSFLAKVTPYLENIQQKQGLYAFKVVMDESNNGPAVIDQNQLIGQIYVQPTRTAEFISLDFILLPTGAEFPG